MLVLLLVYKKNKKNKKKKVEMEEGGRELVVSPVKNRSEHYENGQKVYENLGHKPNAVHAGKMAFDRGFYIY